MALEANCFSNFYAIMLVFWRSNVTFGDIIFGKTVDTRTNSELYLFLYVQSAVLLSTWPGYNYTICCGGKLSRLKYEFCAVTVVSDHSQ
jgi:hypothetical protein